MFKLPLKNRLPLKGFTLIELLIVMAVVAVIAGIVLVVINPAEQLARGRDAGRKNTVGTLGRAMQSYIVSQAFSTAPTASSTWQTILQGSGAIRSINTTTGNTTCTANTNNQGNYCYAPNVGAEFWVWTFLEGSNDKTKAGGGAACGANLAGAFVFDSSLGKSGLGCVPSNGPMTVSVTLY